MNRPIAPEVRRICHKNHLLTGAVAPGLGEAPEKGNQALRSLRLARFGRLIKPPCAVASTQRNRR